MAEPRRFVFLAGTAHYVHLDGYDLPSVRDDLHLLRRLFVDEFGYELIGGRPLVNPSSAHLRISLSDWFVAGERTPDDLVIVYYSGHGIVSQGQELFLLTRDSRLEQVPATALSAREIPWHVLPEDPQGGVPTTAAGVFVVIDTCYAGAGTANIIALAAERHAQAGGETTVLALACSRPKEEADQGVFAKALAETLRNRSGRLGGTQQPDIDPFALTDALNDYFGQRDERQRAELGVVRMRRLQPFFPNPQFHAAVPPGLEITAQRAVLAGEVESHVDPEASAIELAPVKVAYFAGRETALAELRTWLNDPPDGRARVVTGGPGSGKSALLRELMAEGIGIDVAIQAKGATGAEIASRIGSALGITTDPDRLVAQLAERRGRCAIVVDALDEASEPGPVSALLSEVARSAPNVHLLVATRPQLLDHLDTHTRTVVDLDAERYFDETDVVRAVAGRLREEPGSPYGSDPDLAEAVAATVARRAGRSFLFAGLMGAGLAAEPTPTMPADVPADVDGVRAALERELERYGDDRERVQDLLRPLAYALGRGFPWAGLWPQLAGALSGSTYVDADIEWLLGNAGGLVIEDVEDDRSVYRLFHEELARTLGGAGAQADAHAAVVERLLAAVPAAPNGGADWARADPYARRHLSTHAIRAGLLDELTHDVGFLAAAEPERLLTALDRAGQRELAQVVRMSLHRTGRASIAERAAYLELIAREQGLEDLAAQLRAGDLDPPWHCRWAYWTPASPHRVIATPHGEAYAHEAIEVHGVMTLFTGGLDGTIQSWDLLSGESLGPPLLSGGPRVIKVAPVVAAEQVWLAVERRPYDGPSHVMVLGGTGERIAGRFARESRPAWVVHGGRTLLVTAKGSRLVARDLSEPAGVPVERKPAGAITCLDTAVIGNEPLVVCGHAGGEVTVTRLVARPTTRRLRTGGKRVRSVAVTSSGLIVAVDDDSALRSWDARTGRVVGRGGTFEYHDPAVASYEGRDVLLGHDDLAVVVVDPSGGEVMARLRGHSTPSRSLSTCAGDGHSWVIGDDSGAVRVFDLADADSASADEPGRAVHSLVAHPDRRHTILGGSRVVAVADDRGVVSVLVDAEAKVLGLATGSLDGEAIVAGIQPGGTAVLWRLSDGARIADLRTGRDESLTAIALREPDQAVTVGWAPEGVIRHWDLHRSATTRTFEISDELVYQSSLLEHDGRLLAATSGDRAVRVWDVDSEQLVLGPLYPGGEEGRTGEVVEFGLLRAGHVVLGSSSYFDDPVTVKVWQLDGGEDLATFDTGNRSVYALAAGVMAGRDIVVGGADTAVCVWDLQTGPLAAIELDARVHAVIGSGTDGLLVATDKGAVRLDLRL